MNHNYPLEIPQNWSKNFSSRFWTMKFLSPWTFLVSAQTIEDLFAGIFLMSKCELYAGRGHMKYSVPQIYVLAPFDGLKESIRELHRTTSKRVSDHLHFWSLQPVSLRHCSPREFSLSLPICLSPNPFKIKYLVMTGNSNFADFAWHPFIPTSLLNSGLT